MLSRVYESENPSDQCSSMLWLTPRLITGATELVKDAVVGPSSSVPCAASRAQEGAAGDRIGEFDVRAFTVAKPRRIDEQRNPALQASRCREYDVEHDLLAALPGRARQVDVNAVRRESQP